jgi:hypothetical protein
MKSQLEPSYLRYIYDGLVKGSIHPENAAELPNGLIGLYEEAFDERQPVHKRQKLLERFAIWALLKKEVSVAFVAEVLGESEDQIQDFIATYSAWFNSPESGKYQLYHERLKVYLLQKLSEGELHLLHEKLISRLEKAIEEQKADEFEWYGLEFLTQHYAVNAILKGSGSKLIDLAYNQNHWQRQLKISKGYIWTKSGLHSVMNWASKYNDDEVIECGLQLVDLHNQEQNAAPQIVSLVAEGDFDSALKRIEQFGGNDKEGLQRKFILYMLCLMELTLLESKIKPFRREGIEKILKHLDEQLPVDHSVLNWGEFFSSYLVFQLADRWNELALDYLIVYKRTDHWDNDWIQEKGPLSDLQLELMLNCIGFIRDESTKIDLLFVISKELAKQGKIEDAFKSIHGIIDESFKSKALHSILIEIAVKGQLEECIAFANSITNESVKSSVLKDISIELAHYGRIEEAIECLGGISDKLDKSYAIENISIKLAKNGKLKEAIKYAQGINDARARISALSEISIELNKKGRSKVAQSVLQIAWDIAEGISDKSVKSRALCKVATKLSKQEKIQEAIICARGIHSNKYKSIAFLAISQDVARKKHIDEATAILNEALENARRIDAEQLRIKLITTISEEFFEQGKFEDSELLLQEAIQYGQSIRNNLFKNEILKQISIELALKGKFEKSIQFTHALTIESDRISILACISTEMAKQKKFKEAEYTMQEAIKNVKSLSIGRLRDTAVMKICRELANQDQLGNMAFFALYSLGSTQGMSSKRIQSCYIADISSHFAKLGRVDNVDICIQHIPDNTLKNRALNVLSNEMVKQGEFEVAIGWAQKISSNYDKNGALESIYIEIAKRGDYEMAIEGASRIMDESKKINAIIAISTELNTYNRLLESQQLINVAYEYIHNISGISEQFWKCTSLTIISKELTKQKRTKQAECAIEEAIFYARNIEHDEFTKSELLYNIALEIFLQGRTENSLSIARELGNFWKSKTLAEISTFLWLQGKKQESETYLKEAYVSALDIRNERDKNKALIHFSCELAKQGKIDNAFQLARNIGSNSALKFITRELANKGDCQYAETVSLKIDQRDQFFICWKEIASHNCNENDWPISLQLVHQFQNVETKRCYLEGFADSIGIVYCRKGMICSTLNYYLNDIESMNILLQKHALFELFVGNAKQDKINRFNSTLNIKWAIDIKNELN